MLQLRPMQVLTSESASRFDSVFSMNGHIGVQVGHAVVIATLMEISQ